MPVPTTREECYKACRHRRIPNHMWEGMANYFIDHNEVGSFLRLAISNDYAAAAGAADSENLHALLGYIQFMYNEAPCGSHGSPEAYKAWTDREVWHA